MDDRLDLLLPGLVTRDTDLELEFETLLAETSTLAFRVAYGVLRHPQDAEDVAQDSFAKAYRHFRRLRDRERFKAWLVRMTWRTALDRQRSNRRRGTRELVMDGASLAGAARTDGMADQAARDRAAALWAAIDTLPEKLRLVVVLSGIEGHDHKEVAALLRIPEGTVKSRMFLARQQLKEALR